MSLIPKIAVAIPLISLLSSACAGRQDVEEPQPMVVDGPVSWQGDEDLAPVLVRPEMGNLEMEAAERVMMRLGVTEYEERLGVLVEDSAAPWLVRLNGLKLLAARGALSQMASFGVALKASDERVRVAAAAHMREFMSIRPEAAIEILRFALKDPSHRVQTAALQVLGDRDIASLREFLPHAKNPDVRKITLDLIQAAEERGAPMVAIDTLGTLERATATGAKLTFRPTLRWPHWHAALGDVFVALPGKKAVLVARGVEQVGNVVPAFFTAEGTTLVYEINREIHARDLTTGADRKLADGIAPRILPFTNDVIFFAEVRNKRTETPNSFGFKYDVLRVPVAGGTPAVVGQVGASALNDLKGNYSTVRWSRIEEQEGNFYLVGEMINSFQLPSPFGQ